MDDSTTFLSILPFLLLIFWNIKGNYTQKRLHSSVDYKTSFEVECACKAEKGVSVNVG